MDELMQCFEILRRPVGWFGNQSGKIQALNRVAHLGDQKHAAWIFDLLFENDKEVAFAAAATVASLMKKVRPQGWTSLYASLHGIAVRKQDVARLDQFPAEQAVYLLGIATLNGSGYVREESLSRLGAIRRPEVLPYIMLRLADWVPQIRTLAANLIQVALERGLVGSLLDCIYLLAWMERVERTDLTSAREMIRAALARRSTEELRAGLESQLPEARLLCYRALFVDVDAQADLVDKALRDPAPQVRSWVLGQIAAGHSSTKQSRLSQLLADKSATLRNATLHVVAASHWTEMETQVAKMIFDDAANVRDAARFYLMKNGHADFAQKYREHLGKLATGVTQGAVAGLAETGTVADYDLVAAYTCHLRAKIRAAALAGIARLGLDRAIPQLISSVCDPSAKVRRAAIAALARGQHAEIRVPLLLILEKGNPEGKRAALVILAGMGSWQSLRDILYAITCCGDVLIEAGWSHLGVWFSQHRTGLFVRPTSAMMLELEQLALRIQARLENDSVHAPLWRGVCDLLKYERTITARTP